MELKVHHIGYAVLDIESAIHSFNALGFSSISPITKDDTRNVNIVFMKSDSTIIELVAPIASPNPVDGILKKTGPSSYHICYEVPDMSIAIDELKKEKYMVLRMPEPAVAINGNNVAFMYNKNAGMIELVEIKG